MSNDDTGKTVHPALGWWQDLQDDRGAVARLKRAMPMDAMLLEPTLRLFRRLGLTERLKLPRVATLACVLASVRTHDASRRFANAIGRKTMDDEEGAKLKPLRFQRLMTAADEDEIVRAFRRALAIAEPIVDVEDLARMILFFETDRTKRSLTFDYFGAGIAAPQEPLSQASPSQNLPAI
jgi:CRISPR system Cascade subunit CasB